MPRAAERITMQKITFPLQGHPHVELNQLLKLCGLCDSGGAGKQLVADGRVKVNGKPESRKTCKITAGQKVALGDVQISVVEA
ncbi:ribosome-associated protein [Herbaspirillum sp. SJZ130]|nr:ribosome-associated protein [Herbaspirillum sp. SJZ130]TQK14840.1 ribosome-associated protein [Herbaspirillum sp. SJZ106]